MTKKQSCYSMLSTNPESRIRPDPGMRSTGAFAAALGSDRVVGGLQKFRTGKVIGRNAGVAENVFYKGSFRLAECTLQVMLFSNPGWGSTCCVWRFRCIVSHDVGCQLPLKVSDSVRHWEFLQQKFKFWFWEELNISKGKLPSLRYNSQRKIGFLHH